MSALDGFIPDDAPSRTLFSMTTRLPADLAPYSAYPGEGELLIPARNVFDVVNVERFSRSASRARVDALARTARRRGGGPLRTGNARHLCDKLSAQMLTPSFVCSSLTIVELKAVANLLGLPV
jgi:hypothetical protein